MNVISFFDFQSRSYAGRLNRHHSEAASAVPISANEDGSGAGEGWPLERFRFSVSSAKLFPEFDGVASTVKTTFVISCEVSSTPTYVAVFATWEEGRLKVPRLPPELNT